MSGREIKGEGSGTVPRHLAMSWAKRLKRVFGIEVERCDQCGGEVKIIAAIESAAGICSSSKNSLKIDKRAELTRRDGYWSNH